MSDPTTLESERLLQALSDGEWIVLPTDAGAVLAADLFNATACARLRATAPEGRPVVLLARAEHLDALAADLSADARILVRRFLPGPLALAFRPSPLAPAWALLEEGLVALSAPGSPPTARLIAGFGRPLLSVACWLEGEAQAPPATILDVTRRPARILRSGTPDRGALERYVLLE